MAPNQIAGLPAKKRDTPSQTRRYLFALYPTNQQIETLNRHRRMIAELWNALLQRHEDIQRRTTQRQPWRDHDGRRRNGITIHDPTWKTQRKKSGEIATIQPAQNGKPKPFTDIDMQNEVTWLCNQIPEWREMSVWCGHRTAQLLHRAFEAYYRRMKELSVPAVYEARAQKFIERKGRKPTRHELAGYPRFKRSADHDSIPQRFLSGCKMVPYVPPRTGSSEHARIGTGASRRQVKAGAGRRWQLTLKGVTGVIQARGCFPGEVKKWLDADVMFRDGRWWISVCVEIERAQPRVAGPEPVTIKFDLLDDFAKVNGHAETPQEIVEASLLQDTRDEIQAAHDLKWPRGQRAADETDRAERAESRAALSRLSARIARKRRNALHKWSANIIRRASDLTIIVPPIRENTRTPRGGEKRWGANVSVVSDLNRNTLAQASGAAVQMLRYKAEEAGIRCDVIADETPKIAVGGDLVTAGKQLRRARRELKQELSAA